jgi:hypothetical protein
VWGSCAQRVSPAAGVLRQTILVRDCSLSGWGDIRKRGANVRRVTLSRRDKLIRMQNRSRRRQYWDVQRAGMDSWLLGIIKRIKNHQSVWRRAMREGGGVQSEVRQFYGRR